MDFLHEAEPEVTLSVTEENESDEDLGDLSLDEGEQDVDEADFDNDGGFED